MPTDSSPQAAESSEHDEESRRGFIEYASLAIGAIVSLAPLCIGLFAFLDPLRAGRKAPTGRQQGRGDGKEGYIRVAALSALEQGGAPQRFAVIADRQDAWNYIPAQPIGAVFIERTGESEVRVFNATCPHAGCSVSCDGQSFNCPCHNSSFNLDGTKHVSESGRENPSPRNLDSLLVDPDQLAKGEIWIKFVNFFTGKKEPIPKS